MMNRFLFVSLAALSCSALANAGTIVYVGALGTTDSVAGGNGLTKAYVTGTTSSCIGAQITGNTGFTTCATGSSSGGTMFNYTNTMFAKATLSSPTNGTLPNQVPSTSSVEATLSDSTLNTTFAMVNDTASSSGTGNNAVNYWGIVANSITIPVGVFGVDKAWTMINDNWGAPGSQNTWVTFNFGTASNGGTISSVTVKLNNYQTSDGTYNGTAGTLRVLDSLECAANSGVNPTPPCVGYSGAGSSPTASTLWNANYASANPGGTSPYQATSGKADLGDQYFDFASLIAPTVPTYLSQYLVSIQVTNSGGATSVSRSELSAITLDVVPTPEPSTIALMLAGFAGVFFVRRKKLA